MGRESRVSSTQCAAGADAPVSNSNSALSAPDSDSNDDASSSDDDFRRHKHVVQQSTNVAVTSARTGRSAFPTVRRPDSPTVHDVSPPPPSGARHTPHGVATEHVFKYDSGKVTPTRRDENVFRSARVFAVLNLSDVQARFRQSTSNLASL